MLNIAAHARGREQGVTLIEVLVTIVIMAIGLLGLAGLQAKISVAEAESYQRAQAILLLSDMVERISANRSNAFASTSPYAAQYTMASTTIGGSDDGWNPAANCTGAATDPARDMCEWSKLLKGAAETKSSNNVGAMAGARGCITQIQAPDPRTGFCVPGIYLVTVTWQGLHRTLGPAATCAQDLNIYGGDEYRRAISSRVVIGQPGCT